MQIVDEHSVATGCGRILYDPSRVRKPDAALFSIESWSNRGAIEELSGGRGSIAILRQDEQRWVLRHYRRGGMAAKFSADRYLWCGEARTRSFVEWRLLARLRQLDLPVPAPIAARYVRRGLTYTADLITELLPNSITLGAAFRQGPIDPDLWRGIGQTIATFHTAGVHHADLNANNILLMRHADSPLAPASHWHGNASVPPIYLLDFDRGRIRARGSWEKEVLARLRRSLEKVSRDASDNSFDEKRWQWLMEGYEVGERRTADGGR